MRLRTYYSIALLLPLLGLGVAAALNPGDAGLTAGLGSGGTAQWLYPRSAVRGLLAYGVVVVWLLRALHRRGPGALEPLLWWAPLAYVAASAAFLAPLVLAQGRAPEFMAEQGQRAALRVVVHLAIGFGYLGLVMFVRDRLRQSGGLEAPERAGASSAHAADKR
jgi:hypothetical protein